MMFSDYQNLAIFALTFLTVYLRCNVYRITKILGSTYKEVKLNIGS